MRNLVTAETAEQNRAGVPGRYTFNTLPPDSFEGIGFAVAAVRIGDHAHIHVESGRIIAGRDGDPFAARYRMGHAGKLLLRWHEWEVLRAILEPHESVRLAEVENPTVGMAERYAGG